MAAGAQPDYLSFLDTLFGDQGHMGYLDSMTSAAPAVANTATQATGAPGAPGAAPPEPTFTDALSDYSGPVRYHDGTELDAGVLRHLAGQVAQNFDLSRSSGDAFSTKGEQIGFDYDEARKMFKADPTAAQQVVLDMAANLAANGVTDISELALADETYLDNPFKNMDWDPGVYHEMTRKVLARKGADGTTTNLYKTLGYASTYTDPAERKRQQAEAQEAFQAVQAANLNSDYQLDPKLYGVTSAGPGYSDPANFSRTYRGKGGTQYGMDFDAEGKPKFYTTFEETSDAGAIAGLLTIASLGLAGPLAMGIQGAMPSLGAVGSKALAGGLMGGVNSEVTGGKFGKGFLGGAVGGGVSAMNPAGYLGITDKVGGSTFNGAVGGAMRAGVTGGDVGRGLLAGGASGAVSGFNPAGRMGIEDDMLRRSINSGLAGLAGGAFTGNPLQGLLSGAASGALRAGSTQRR